MFHNLKYVVFLILIFQITLIWGQNPLTIGDTAPAIKYSKWIKGEPINEFKKGEIYVIEFWATWCEPCIESIPHLTKLAQKFKGKVNIIGMDGSESPQPEQDVNKLVTDFVKEMGEQMEYGVAIDTKDKYMWKNWLQASGNTSIPKAFIIDKETKIVWIGHPMEHMDVDLEKIVNDKFNAKEEERFRNLSLALKELDLDNPEKTIEQCKNLYSIYPENESVIDQIFMQNLIKISTKDALAEAKNMMKQNFDRVINYVGAFVNQTDNKITDFTEKYLLERIEKEPKNLMALDLLSNLSINMGKNKQAITILEKLISEAREQKIPENNLTSIIEKIKKLKGN